MRRLGRHALTGLLLACAAWARPLHAQDAPPALPAPPASAASPIGTGDVVKLKNGSLFRGTIVELVANDHVDLQVPSGETRRFPMGDVEYAGAFAGAAAPPPRAAQPAPLPPTPAPAAPPGIPVHVVASDSNIQLFEETGESEGTGWINGHAMVLRARHFRRVCTAPCNVELPAGIHELALSADGGSPVSVVGSTEINAPATLHATYESRRGLRIGGIVIMSVGIVGGVVLAVAGGVQSTQDCSEQAVLGSCTSTPSLNGAVLAASLGIVVVSVAVGIVFLLQHDSAKVEVIPSSGAGPLRLPGGYSTEAGLAGPQPSGASLRVRF